MPASDIRWILDDAALAAQCDAWRQCSYLALDTEFMRVDTFYATAALLQVSEGTAVWLIDPLQIGDWRPFAALLDDPGLVKVLHSCSEDLEVFARLTGTRPQPVFDTQLAAGYLGIGFSMGYSRLVKEVLQVELPKDETRSDWLMRPLTPMQVQYAADDVHYLCMIYRILDERMSDERRQWLFDDMAELVASQQVELDPEDAWLEVKAAWRLRPQQLSVLRAVCAWRECEARRRNLPRNRILKERSLWPLARNMPADVAGLAAIEDMQPRILRHDAGRLLAMIEEAKSLPPEQWPAQQAEPLPLEAGAVLKKLRAVGEREAARLGIVPELMLRKKVLEALLRSGWPDGPWQLPDSLRGWRRELMGQALLDTLNRD